VVDDQCSIRANGQQVDGALDLGALGAFYAAAPNPYEIGVAAVITGAGATIVGRSVAAAFEPRTKG
jgi:hypothetical protein